MQMLAQWISWALPQSVANWLLRRVTRLAKSFYTTEPDVFLELLLGAMAWAFRLCRDYRRNLDGFSAHYLFATADGRVRAGGHSGSSQQSL